MPEVLELPVSPPEKPVPPQLAPFAFDSVKAALAGKLSGEARRAKANPQAFATFVTKEQAVNPHACEIERLARQMERLDGFIDKAQTPADFRDLTNARARLFDQWAHLAGIPKPGSRRPGREVTRRSAPPADPTPAETQPPAS